MESVASLFARFGTLFLIANEVRGAILAVPVLYTLWHTGGGAMKLWLCFCTVAGIAFSVLVSMWAVRKWRARTRRPNSANVPLSSSFASG